MRQFSTAFAEHIASGATTLCWCWRIVRTDGLTLGFTDHDLPLAFDGQAFAPAHGLEGGDVADRTGPQTQTSEVLGVLHADAITEDDIVLGRYDGAQVESWRVNWADVGVRELIRVDTIGEIVREDGMFRAELRSGQHALNVRKGRLYHHLCDARLGDGRCRFDLDRPGYRAEAVVTAIPDPFAVEVSGLEGFADGWFHLGLVRWTNGRRIGVEDGVTRHAGGLLGLSGPAGEWVSVGDTLTVFAGCDKQFATCREKFGNGVNFQGFPHIPGNDFVMRYPTDADRLDGQVLVR